MRHATLGASSASRWMNCTSSPSLIETLDSDLRNRTSIFAEEGSAAHALAEEAAEYVLGERKQWDKNYLGQSVGYVNDDYYVMGPDEMYQVEDATGSVFEVTEEMQRSVQLYADTIWGFCEASVAFPRYYVETSVQPIKGRNDVFGTADCILHDTVGGTIWVLDFKYGRGVKVTAQKNAQAMFYACGVVQGALGNSEIADGVQMSDQVNIVIVQPRIEFADGRSLSDWSTTVGELLDWVNDELHPAVSATTNPALAKYEVGSYCRWCPAAAICPLQQSTALKQAQEAFGGDLEALPFSEAKSVELIIPDANNVEGIAAALKIAAVLDNWSSRVKDLADNQAVKNNKALPGFKVVRKRSNRKWADERALVAELKDMGQLEAATTTKIKSPTQLEKAGFDRDFVSERSVKPEGALTVVPEGDPRKEASNAVLAFSDDALDTP